MFDFATLSIATAPGCTQWDYVADRFGAADLLPFTISDMDFATAPCILDAVSQRLAHGCSAQPLAQRGVSRGDCPLVRQPL